MKDRPPGKGELVPGRRKSPGRVHEESMVEVVMPQKNAGCSPGSCILRDRAHKG